VTFEANMARAVEDGRPVQVWASREDDLLANACARAERPLLRVEDGFLRSRGSARGWSRRSRSCRTTSASTTTRRRSAGWNA
jgi:capsule polysaccharide export protein KpsC/LpsZ